MLTARRFWITHNPPMSQRVQKLPLQRSNSQTSLLSKNFLNNMQQQFNNLNKHSDGNNIKLRHSSCNLLLKNNEIFGDDVPISNDSKIEQDLLVSAAKFTRQQHAKES
jgi:hypothetical protein